jgi:hypothetical protein
MIILGNSSVDIFRQTGLRFSLKKEKIVISWVGAIKVAYFHKLHPVGIKIRDIFDKETGWKFLSMGSHDIFELCTYASLGNVVDHFEATFEASINSYYDVFSELNKSGKFGWLVFPQAIHDVQFKNFTANDVLKIAKRFNKRIEELCYELRVPVINPLHKMCGHSGEVLKEFLQQDGSHLNINGVKTYVEEIEKHTGESIYYRSDINIYEPASELESFCSLFIGELGVPSNEHLSSPDVCKILVEYVSKHIKDSGLNLNIDSQTKLLSTGLVDKECHTLICDFAAEIMNISIPLNINLNHLDSIGDIVNYLLNGRYHNKTNESMLNRNDFFISLLGNFDDSAQRKAILAADDKISNVGDDVFAKMQEIAPPDSREVLVNYGIISFWYSLMSARNGNYLNALKLIAQSKKPDIKSRYPFISTRAELYITAWEKKIEENISIWQRLRFRIFDRMIKLIYNNRIDPAWQRTVRFFTKKRKLI